MKKAVILFLFCCFLTSCAAQSGNSTNQSGAGTKDIMIDFKEGIYRNKNWDMIESVIEMDCIPDKETAIKAAEIFLLVGQRQDKTPNLSYDPTAVFYDTEDEIWIVTFAPFEKGLLIPGDSYNIAMRRNTAEVIKIWAS